MISKSRITFVHSLQYPKYREKHKAFIAEGPKVVAELMESGLELIEIFATGNWSGIEIRKDITTLVTEHELEKISRLQTPNQVLAVAKIPEPAAFPESIPELVPVLDSLRDPGNMGTIIRVCDWFGIRHLVCSSDSADIYNPKVVQASMGSLFRVNIHYLQLQDFLSSHAEKAMIYGAYPEGMNVWTAELKNPAFLVIGNEARGISASVSDQVRKKISIPSLSGETRGAESLNASVAAALLINEFCRPR
jgi:RNA methyltransferase, TrmH family